MPPDYFPPESNKMPFLWKIQRGFIRNCCTFKTSKIIVIMTLIIVIIILIMIIITKLLRRCLPSSLLRPRRLHQRGVRLQTRLEGQGVQHQVCVSLCRCVCVSVCLCVFVSVSVCLCVCVRLQTRLEGQRVQHQVSEL